MTVQQELIQSLSNIFNKRAENLKAWEDLNARVVKYRRAKQLLDRIEMAFQTTWFQVYTEQFFQELWSVEEIQSHFQPLIGMVEDIETWFQALEIARDSQLVRF